MKYIVPDFVIIGAMKCGTTTLFKYLEAHPETNACMDKEPEYFGVNWEKGPEWYASLYKKVDGLKYEASTSYTRYPAYPEVPERIKQTAPDCKLIYIIRNPVDRIVSQLHHQIAHRGMVNDAWKTIPDFWTLRGGKHAIDASKYFTQIQKYRDHFESNHILVLRLEDLNKDPAQVFFEIAGFLGIDKHPFDQVDYLSYNQASDKVLTANPILSRVINGLKKVPGLSNLANFIGAQSGKPELLEEHVEYIWDCLEDDMAKLDKYLGYPTGYTRVNGN